MWPRLSAGLTQSSAKRDEKGSPCSIQCKPLETRCGGAKKYLPHPCLPCSTSPTLLGKGPGSLHHIPDPDSEHAEKGLPLYPANQHQETYKRQDSISLGHVSPVPSGNSNAGNK